MNVLGKTLCSAAALVAISSVGAEAQTLRLSTQANAPHPWIDAATVLRDEMLAATDGRVEIEIFNGGSLGNDATVLDEMRMGTVDIVIGGTQEAAPFINEFQLFSLSYLFPDMDTFRRAVSPQGEVFAYFDEVYRDAGNGLTLLALTGGGVRNFSNNATEVHSPEDIAGMRMRVPGSRMDARMWEATGALPTSLPFTELYTGVQVGVVDAFESTISAYVSSKLYEVAPHHARTEHQFMVSHITMSQLSHDRLSPEDREALHAAAAVASSVAIDRGIEYDNTLLEPLISSGQITVTEVDKAPFIEAVQPLHDEVAAELGAEDLLEIIRTL